MTEPGVLESFESIEEIKTKKPELLESLRKRRAELQKPKEKPQPSPQKSQPPP